MCCTTIGALSYLLSILCCSDSVVLPGGNDEDDSEEGSPASDGEDSSRGRRFVMEDVTEETQAQVEKDEARDEARANRMDLDLEEEDGQKDEENNSHSSSSSENKYLDLLCQLEEDHPGEFYLHDMRMFCRWIATHHSVTDPDEILPILVRVIERYRESPRLREQHFQEDATRNPIELDPDPGDGESDANESRTVPKKKRKKSDVPVEEDTEDEDEDQSEEESDAPPEMLNNGEDAKMQGKYL